MILNGVEKSALLLMSIGPEQSGEILKHLTFFEVQKLVSAMMNLNQFSTETLTQVLRECYENANKMNTISCNSKEYFSVMLKKALGEKKGNCLLQDTLEAYNTKIYIEALNFMEPNQVSALLSKEHPQIITTILVHLEKKQVAAILTFLNDTIRSEIILRIAEFNGIEESSFVELRHVIDHLLKNKKLVLSDKGGIKIAASILNSMQLPYEEKTIKKMHEYNTILASQIIQEMNIFDNIIYLKDRYIKTLLHYIDDEKLYIALQKSNDIVKNKFFKNMSQKQAHDLNKSLQNPSYISDAAIENEKKLILMMIKNILEKENDAHIIRKK
ncbi:flagellar motor switch protein FliG [Buchnera aphidicola]|uniref:flagellar motor switch protein FliG n=1 Tax=Buchnera aphidicola TaxID=9 RepID=UPI003464BEAE